MSKLSQKKERTNLEKDLLYFKIKKSEFEQNQKSFFALKKQMNEKVLNYFDEHPEDPYCSDNEILFEKEGKLIRCKRVRSTKIDFDINKMEEIFENDILSEIINKEYLIIDWNKVVELLKKYGVPAKSFIKLISVNKEVNSKRLIDLVELGAIKKGDVRDCSTVTVKSDYIKVSEIEKTEDEVDGEGW